MGGALAPPSVSSPRFLLQRKCRKSLMSMSVFVTSSGLISLTMSGHSSKSEAAESEEKPVSEPTRELSNFAKIASDLLIIRV